MFKLYPDTEKELFYNKDYRPIMDMINTFKMNEIPGIIENIKDALDNAFSYHADMLANALYRDICELKKWYLVRYISCLSSGTIAGFIGSTKYKNIDNAVNKTLTFLFNADPEKLFQLSLDMESIKRLVYDCFKNPNL